MRLLNWRLKSKIWIESATDWMTSSYNPVNPICTETWFVWSLISVVSCDYEINDSKRNTALLNTTHSATHTHTGLHWLLLFIQFNRLYRICSTLCSIQCQQQTISYQWFISRWHRRRRIIIVCSLCSTITCLLLWRLWIQLFTNNMQNAYHSYANKHLCR